MYTLGRRNFLKNTAFIAPILALFPSALQAATVKHLRIGFIGAGEWGRQYLSAALQHRQLEIRAVCDMAPGALSICRPLLQGGTLLYPDIYNDYKQVLGRKDIDAVIIAAPWDTHYGIAKAAMLAGKHVACGTVMGSTVAEHEDIVRTSELTGRQYFTLDEHSYRHDLSAISNMVKQGLFGTLKTVQAGAHYETLTASAITGPSLPYPVFPAAAIAGMLGVHEGNRYMSVEVCRQETQCIIGKQHPVTGKLLKKFVKAEIDMVCLTTLQQQKVYLQMGTGKTSPVSTGYRVNGTAAQWMDATQSIHIAAQGSPNFVWEADAPYLQQYGKREHDNDGVACALHDFVKALGTPEFKTVYAAAANSLIGPLAARSKASGGQPVMFPDRLA